MLSHEDHDVTVVDWVYGMFFMSVVLDGKAELIPLVSVVVSLEISRREVYQKLLFVNCLIYQSIESNMVFYFVLSASLKVNVK